MKDLPKDMDKVLVMPDLPKPPRRKRTWSLLLISSSGRTLTISKLMAKAIAVGLFMAVVSALAIGLAVSLDIVQDENKSIRHALKQATQQNQALKNEKDLLMARLVVAEAEKPKPEILSELKTLTENEQSQQSPAQQPQEAPIYEAPIDFGVETGPEPKPSVHVSLVEEQPAAETAVVPPAVPPRVDVGNFSSDFEPDSNMVKTRFRLKKIDTSAGTISGRAFVILKSEHTDQSQWLISPSISLDAGRPVNTGQGQFFSIARFKQMNFKFKNVRDHSQYQSAAVLVYAKDGQLLLEKEFALK